MLSPEVRGELARVEQVDDRTGRHNTHQLRRATGTPGDRQLGQSGGQPRLHARHAASLVIIPEAGKVFGMRALVSGELPEVDVTCMESCSITTVPRDVFLALLKNNPQVYFAVCQGTEF